MSDVPELGEVMDFDLSEPQEDRMYLVLYDDDYDDILIDGEDNVALLVDIDQVGEVLRLSADILASLSHKDVDGDQPIRDFIDGLEELVDDE